LKVKKLKIVRHIPIYLGVQILVKIGSLDCSHSLAIRSGKYQEGKRLPSTEKSAHWHKV
jgi:DNA-binding transcriptional regulator YhcF (GntR family)